LSWPRERRGEGWGGGHSQLVAPALIVRREAGRRVAREELLAARHAGRLRARLAADAACEGGRGVEGRGVRASCGANPERGGRPFSSAPLPAVLAALTPAASETRRPCLRVRASAAGDEEEGGCGTGCERARRSLRSLGHSERHAVVCLLARAFRAARAPPRQRVRCRCRARPEYRGQREGSTGRRTIFTWLGKQRDEK
jgi:hypothetical protein